MPKIQNRVGKKMPNLLFTMILSELETNHITLDLDAFEKLEKISVIGFKRGIISSGWKRYRPGYRKANEIGKINRRISKRQLDVRLKIILKMPVQKLIDQFVFLGVDKINGNNVEEVLNSLCPLWPFC